MTARNSQEEDDAITWQSTGVKIGVSGLDLREPSAPGALTKLLNARFVDDRTATQRAGHNATLLRAAGDFPALGLGFAITNEWYYGHGIRVADSNAVAWENAYHPIAGRARGVFKFDDSDVVWTGDRLLIAREDEACLGRSTFWSRGGGQSLERGIPAYLPVQTDSTPPAQVTGTFVETAVTDSLRVYVNTDGAAPVSLIAWIVDRATGAVINRTAIAVDSNLVEPKVVNSAGFPVVLFRTSADELRCTRWTGFAWTAVSTVATGVKAYDIAVAPGGFYVAWRNAAGALFLGKFSGKAVASQPFSFGTTYSPTPAASGQVALGVSPGGDIAVLYEHTAGLRHVSFTPEGVFVSNAVIATDPDWAGGISICSRGLRNSSGTYDWVIHASRGAEHGAVIVSGTSSTRYNSSLASKSFRVGDEVFCWFRTNNSGTNYLVGGLAEPQVCGIADREEALERPSPAGNKALPHVLPDPLSELRFTWARPYNTGQTYARGGNVRVGDLDFGAPLSSARFGRSVYLGGSHVRNFDGITVGDAGFHDYPKITGYVASTINYLPPYTETTVNINNETVGKVVWRVYPVRYNARGERFSGASIPFTVNLGVNGFGDPTDTLIYSFGVNLTITTIPVTNHDDVVFEVYRTEKGGTTFYLEGTVANSLSAPTVTFRSQMEDEDLRKQPGDTRAAGVGVLSELEEWGPSGCAILAVAGDRLWAGGGQIPGGICQFSKLKEEGEGAGFDAIAGYQVVDTEGRQVTSIAGLNDVTAVFFRDRLQVIAGPGPDNYGRGSFTIPQILLADGATSHVGTVITQVGVLFYGVEGPRLLTTALAVESISAPVRPLAATIVPSGVQANLERQEVIWYSESGDALLWNYLGRSSRWASWSGLHVAGCTEGSLVTTDGRLLRPDDAAKGDGGQPFPFTIRLSNLRAEEVLQGKTLLGKVGVSGAYKGPHRLRIRVYFNGSPLWSARDEWTWDPQEETWLTPGSDFAELTAAQIDILASKDRSGAYVSHRRVSRHNCRLFDVEISTIESIGPSFTPYELTLELGARGGLTRIPGG